jgi:metal-dependent HD superfamily phosphatase/phosphodiesterase
MIEDANIGLKLEVEDLVVVSPNLVYAHLKEFRLAKVFTFLESDIEVQSYMWKANYMTVDRLGYNDHSIIQN